MQLLLQQLFGRQIRPVFRNENVILGHVEQFHLLDSRLGTENQADGCRFSGPAFVFVQPVQIQLHLALIPGLEAADLEFHRHQTPELSMEKEQVEIEIVPVDGHALLTLNKGESPAKLQNEQFQFFTQGMFQFVLQIALFEPQKVEKVGIFESSPEMLEIPESELCIRQFRSFESLALNLVLQFAFTPAILQCSMDIERAGFITRQLDQKGEMGPAQL